MSGGWQTIPELRGRGIYCRIPKKRMYIFCAPPGVFIPKYGVVFLFLLFPGSLPFEQNNTSTLLPKSRAPQHFGPFATLAYVSGSKSSIQQEKLIPSQ